MAPPMTKTKIGVSLLASLGVILVVIGVVFLSILPTLLRSKMHENLYLAENKETFEKWRKTPIPVYFYVYLFNVTNPYEVEHHGAKPFVKEVGPYVFKQMRRKDVLGWNDTEMTVTYDDIKTYYFVKEMSEDPEIMIYSLNMPLLGIAEKLRNLKGPFVSWLATGVDDVLYRYNHTLFNHKPARVLLFEGYKVDFLEDITGLIEPFYTVKDGLPNNTFGFFYGKNNSGDGIFTVYTGKDDLAKYTQIKTWNNHNHLLWWNDDFCDMLNGTDGGQFPPPISKEDILYVYTAELCRSVYLEYLVDVKVKDIPAYRFVTPERLFASPDDNGDNQCYCTRKNRCHMKGILDITTCRKGMPLAVTGPHFYLGHEDFTTRVDGLHPDAKSHETYVDIEPMTGVVLRASRKLQMNFILEPYEHFRQTAHAPESVFPLLWIIEQAEASDELATLFKDKVRKPITIAKSVLTACIVLGLLFIVTAGFITVCVLIRQQKATEKTIKAQCKPVAVQPTEEKRA